MSSWNGRWRGKGREGARKKYATLPRMMAQRAWIRVRSTEGLDTAVMLSGSAARKRTDRNDIYTAIEAILDAGGYCVREFVSQSEAV
jgi:hypothetical protein